MRILCTASVGSHLETMQCIELALRTEMTDVEVVIVDLVRWHRWDAMTIPYRGQADRMKLVPEDWGYGSNGILGCSLTANDWEGLLEQAERFLRRMEPDLFLTMNDRAYPDWAFLHSAKSVDLPTLMIQEGPRMDILPAMVSPMSRIEPGRLLRRLKNLIIHGVGWKHEPATLKSPLYGRGGADRLAVASEFYARLFTQAGVVPESISVTGIPRFDLLQTARERWRTRSTTKEACAAQHVLIISQPFVRYGVLSQEEQDGLHCLVADGLKELARRLPVDATVRMHPSERSEDIRVILENSPVGTSVQSPSMPLAHVLPDFDLVIGFTSTALLEAASIGLPVIRIKTRTPSSFVEATCGPPATSASELAILSLGALRDVGGTIAQTALNNELGRLDGKASQRVATLCKRILENPDVAKL